MSVASQLRRADRLIRERLRDDAGRPRKFHAVDFATGGRAAFARGFDRRGLPVAAWRAGPEERLETFRHRAEKLCVGAGAAQLVFGGIDDLAEPRTLNASPAPRGLVALPDGPLHPSQLRAVALAQRHRFVALRCGRRWGKSAVLIALAVDGEIVRPLRPELQAGGPDIRRDHSHSRAGGRFREPNGRRHHH
jgi:hypothetical protein